MDNNNIIIIDTREPTDKISKILMEDIISYKIFPNFRYEALEYGDYLIRNNNITVLIERKAYNDYITSIGDSLKKRFFKMRQEADYAILILEGQPPQVDHHVYYINGRSLMQGIQFNAYNNFMFSAGMDGIIIIPTKDLNHTMLAISSIYDYIGKLDIKDRIPKCTDMKELLSMFPGIGRKKANYIKKQYATMSLALENYREWIPRKALENFDKKW